MSITYLVIVMKSGRAGTRQEESELPTTANVAAWIPHIISVMTCFHAQVCYDGKFAALPI